MSTTPDNGRFVSPPVRDLARLRQPLTRGEKKVLDVFNQCLSPKWEIYIQPHLNGLRPDFVLLNPDVGIAVFEVKDWDLSAMQYGVLAREGKAPLLWAEKDGTRFSLQKENPIEKIYLYRKELFEIYCPRLKQGAGFAAITAGVIFPYCTQQQLLTLFAPSLEYREMTKFPAYSPISGTESINFADLDQIFPESKRRTSQVMNESLTKDLRNWLLEPDFSVTQRTPIELDKYQLSLITSRTQSGYRRIRGAAGSGKSLILAARAAELLKQGKRVLVVTFNITLLHYLMDVAVRYSGGSGKTRTNITWLNFHAWCLRICMDNDADAEYKAILGHANRHDSLNVKLPALVTSLLSDAVDSELYDAVLVDEGQDFRPLWWDALRLVCKPGGEMLLVADETQDIYGTASSWTDEAMTGAGFSGPWAELGGSYRMPEPALALAANFAAHFLPEGARIVPRSTQMVVALEPCYLRWVQYAGSDDAQICCDEILGLFTRAGSERLSVADATFLCDKKSLGYEVISLLGKKGIRCVHTFDQDEKESRRQKVGFYMGDARVKATTLHSFKGWEAKTLVVYMGRNITPGALALLYTGLTRLKRHPDGSYLTVISNSNKLREYGESWPDFVEVN
ncbi:MAG: NERD domain-containing protein/DEAD/DEAH box helicase [Polaromonas sp.]|nr:NERD domain-containing protein/DEAD/DEAH box helicase [Polaromonas sp.]